MWDLVLELSDNLRIISFRCRTYVSPYNLVTYGLWVEHSNDDRVKN